MFRVTFKPSQSLIEIKSTPLTRQTADTSVYIGFPSIDYCVILERPSSESISVSLNVVPHDFLFLYHLSLVCERFSFCLHVAPIRFDMI